MCDYVFKILLVGDMGVGKTSLCCRYFQDRFFLQYHPTVGIDFNVCHVEVAGKRILLQVWDTAGEERFGAMLPRYYSNSHGVIIVYDTTTLSSFHNVGNWLKELGVFCSKDVSLMLVGNKCDELAERKVTQEKAARFAENNNLSFSEASAKSGVNVRDVFGDFAVEVYNRLVLGILPSHSTRSRKVDSDRTLLGGKELAEEDQGQGADVGDVLVPDENRIRLEDTKSSEEKGRRGYCF